MSIYLLLKDKSKSYRHGNHSVGLAHVHLVWIPKRRKKVLMGDVKSRLSVILHEVATENGWFIKAIEIAPDHVHIRVEHGSQVAIHQIIKALLGALPAFFVKNFPIYANFPVCGLVVIFMTRRGKLVRQKL